MACPIMSLVSKSIFHVGDSGVFFLGFFVSPFFREIYEFIRINFFFVFTQDPN